MKFLDGSLFLIVFIITILENRAQNVSTTTITPATTLNTTVVTANSTTTISTVPTTTTTTTTTSTTTTTTTANPCSTNSPFCNSNGNCSIDTLTNQQKCSCQPNYYGSRCELVACSKDEDPKQCLNEGICVKNILTQFLSCQCTSDYTGATCEKPFCIDLCYNNGICEYDSTNKTRVCRCLNRFYGEYCQFDYCTKEANTCAKSCYLYKDGTQGCKCACNDECNQAFCTNNGVCEMNNNNLACKCKVGYSGPQCKVDACRGYCFNNGTCLRNETDSITCRCQDAFTGKRCELLNNTPSKQRSTAGRVFLYILVLSLIVCTVALTIFAYKRGGLEYVREKFDNLTYRLRSSYEPAPAHGRSNIPYVQTNNKPEDSYTDPFS